MAEHCENCGAKLTEGGIIASANYPLPARSVATVNFVNRTDYTELCTKCGGDLDTAAVEAIRAHEADINKGIEQVTMQFPLMTTGWLPPQVEYLVLGLVTANVTIGTGLFNEFSQGFSDLLGAVNTKSGMALKVNKGEAAARGMLVQKAVGLGANCVIGVDLDYGVTNNNAATVNMQGTAVRISNPEAVLSAELCKAAIWLEAAWQRRMDIARWRSGDFRDGEVFPGEADAPATYAEPDE